MVLAAVLIPIFLGTSPGRAPFDFDSKAASVRQLVARLSAETGEKLGASAELAQKIVFVHAHGVTPANLKTRLADVLQAEWTMKSGVNTLVRTPALEKRIWVEHLAYRRKLVDVALEDARKHLESAFDAKALAKKVIDLGDAESTNGDPAAMQRMYQERQEVYRSGPLARLLARLVLACDPSDLAAVGPYERRVFRIDPTVMQRGFDNSKYQAAVDAFAIEQQAWIDEAAKANLGEAKGSRMVSDPRVQLEIPPHIPPAYLEVARGEMTSLFNVNLRLADIQAPFEPIVAQLSFADPARKFLDRQANPPTPAADDPVVDLSDESKEFQKRMIEAFMTSQPASMSPRMRDMVLHLDTNDPLAWTVSDALSAYAATRQENLIAAIPDSALLIGFMLGRDQKVRVGSFIRALQESGTMELREKDGWGDMRPIDRYEAEIDFTPRTATIDLMRSTMAAGRLDIHDYAKYAFESGRLNRGGLGDYFLAMYDRSVLGTSDQTDWKALQLYGSFTSDQQNRLEAGARIPLTGMNRDQRRIVERIVYAKKLNGATTFEAVEPTQSFALGLPSTCVVSATVRKTPVIVAYGRGPDGVVRPLRGLNAYTLATIEAEIVGDPGKMASYGVTGLVGYAAGADKAITLRVEPAPGAFAQSNITVPDYSATATPTSWDKLPDPLRKQVEAAIAQLKARKDGQPKEGVPPPKEAKWIRGSTSSLRN